MKIAHTRAMIRAALDGRLAKVETRPDPIFGLHVPASCPDVPADVLDPRRTWSDKDAYDSTARALARSEEHTSELQSLMRISYAVFCLKKKKTEQMSTTHYIIQNIQKIYSTQAPKQSET